MSADERRRLWHMIQRTHDAVPEQRGARGVRATHAHSACVRAPRAPLPPAERRHARLDNASSRRRDDASTNEAAPSPWPRSKWTWS